MKVWWCSVVKFLLNLCMCCPVVYNIICIFGLIYPNWACLVVLEWLCQDALKIIKKIQLEFHLGGHRTETDDGVIKK